MDNLPPPPPADYPPLPPTVGGSSRQGSSKKWIFWGCGGCLTLLIIGGIAAFFIFKGVLGLLEKSPPYQDGLAKAQSSAEVKAALGEPIESDGMVSGNINYNNDAGNADLAVPIKGPKGTGILHIKSAKDPGQNWSSSTLSVTPQGGQPIDLLQPQLCPRKKSHNPAILSPLVLPTAYRAIVPIQYRAISGSISSAHWAIPPRRLHTFSTPRWRRKCAACPERIP